MSVEVRGCETCRYYNPLKTGLCADDEKYRRCFENPMSEWEPPVQPTVSVRAECLTKAMDCVCGHRETDYGKPEDNFKVIADLWTAYTGFAFTPLDVSMMLALLKIGRISSGTATTDSFVDLAGYAACGAEIAQKEVK